RVAAVEEDVSPIDHRLLHFLMTGRTMARSVRRPQAGRAELHRSSIRIAEVEAQPAALPRDAALDVDAELCETRAPRVDVRRVDREGEMHRTAAVMAGHEAARRIQRAGVAALEQQQ